MALLLLLYYHYSQFIINFVLLRGHLIADTDFSVGTRVWLPFELYIAWHFTRFIWSVILL